MISTKTLEHKVFSLADKEIRLFWTNHSLQSYKDHGRVPRGLRVYKEPAQYKDDLFFFDAWKKLHLKHSLEIMQLVLDRNRTEYESVTTELCKAKTELRSRLSESQFQSFSKKLEKKMLLTQMEVTHPPGQDEAVEEESKARNGHRSKAFSASPKPPPPPLTLCLQHAPSLHHPRPTPRDSQTPYHSYTADTGSERSSSGHSRRRHHRYCYDRYLSSSSSSSSGCYAAHFHKRIGHIQHGIDVRNPSKISPSVPDDFQAIDFAKCLTEVHRQQQLGRQPPKDHHQQRPPKDHHQQRPPKDHHQQRPPKDHHQQRPPKDHHQQRPPKDHHQQRPPSDHHQQRPTSDHHQQRPTSDHHQQRPTSDHHQQRPTSDHHQQRPTSDHHQQRPPKDHHQQRPTRGHHQQQPPTSQPAQTAASVSSLRSPNRTAEDPSSWSGFSVCQDGWISLNRTCYSISEEKKSWEESRRQCVELQGDLAIIGPSQTILTGYIQNLRKEFWVGLRKEKRDLYIGELWYWVDNTIEENIPEDSADLCVKLGERLSPESCSSQLPRICQRPEGK
ncbi:uncharacterized protein [Engystomops pustulosus]|uniref:uncharacterized protein n=1 Tax=Engystomops pustulosus TaxID=76066 RepID=UPI003AFADC53